MLVLHGHVQYTYIESIPVSPLPILFQLALHVLSFLDARDLLVAAQTCRTWYTLCEDSLYVFQRGCCCYISVLIVGCLTTLINVQLLAMACLQILSMQIMERQM